MESFFGEEACFFRLCKNFVVLRMESFFGEEACPIKKGCFSALIVEVLFI